jgi:hypothetical protein
MNIETKSVRTSVRHLLPGDMLLGSNTVILTAPYRGLRTPSNKVLLTVERRNRGVRTEVVSWNPSTTMTVERPVR